LYTVAEAMRAIMVGWGTHTDQTTDQMAHEGKLAEIPKKFPRSLFSSM